MIDLDAYFARIKYSGSRTAVLSTLRAIHALHPISMPFENLTPFIGQPTSLDLGDLQNKMVGRRRGGYCFEQNTLFKAVLEQLGFSVSSLVARVLWMKTSDQPPSPRTHMALKVDLLDGVYIADVGFGGLLMSSPLRLVADLVQQTPTGQLRFSHSDGFWTLQGELSKGWRDMYRFTLESQLPIDLEVANWFACTHPNSRFRNNLLLERLTPDARISLFNRRHTRRFFDGAAEETQLVSARDLKRALASDFDIESPADIDAMFARLPE